ncbi:MULTISPECIES: methyl-accepting chemotaxis protein [unclassified Paenibacillus]|uniref:methyl-accepting chemotaxis protein n=1 Tax=unclassified Paenibacillus TaxID=185978 RepID=UPI0008AEB81D|nr:MULTISPECIES: HAMP domain-containing methyl-accepting chemotaxis protein [unclassified Paenibacillus]QLG36826.1 methyl-accepting chemotaxis protein [Paenibacillus sp. E222]SEP21750.1 methyl-accepting chemotaxis protein [Paenibacillus sp. OK076]
MLLDKIRWSTLPFFAKNLVISFGSITLIGVILITAGYQFQKSILIQQLYDQAEVTTQKWSDDLDTSKVLEAANEKNYDGTAQKVIRDYLDSIHELYPNIAQAYIFGTELEKGNETSIIAIPTSLVESFEEGNMAAGTMYPLSSQIVEALEDMKVDSEPGFSSFYTDDYGTWTTIMYPIKNAEGNTYAAIYFDVDASAVPKGLHKLITYSSIFLIVFLIVFMVLQYVLLKKTLKPIRDLMKGIEAASSGNLDVSIHTGRDDLGIINQKFNTMIQRFNDTMFKVQTTSYHLSDSSKKLLDISEKNNDNIQMISSNIRDISHGLRSQDQASVESARAMTEMSTVVQTIASSSADVADEASSMEERSNTGHEIMQQVVEQMRLISGAVKHTSESIQSLESRSNEISSIVNMITQIADQTNLLALNASIEAARVGEEGKGFAVVAGEVRKLAEQSQDSAKQIRTLIDGIQRDILQSAEAMHLGSQEVEKGSQVTMETGQFFEDILTATNKVANQIQDISSSTEEISASTQEMSATADELSASVSKAAHSSKQIEQSIAEQESSMASIVAASDELSAVSGQLQELISFFKVRAN